MNCSKNFEERVKELDVFFENLKKLSVLEMDVSVSDRRTGSQILLDDDFIKIVKATSILLIYNMIESAVRGGVSIIYETISTDRLTYENACDEIRKIWIDAHYRNIFTPSASWISARSKATELIEQVLGRTALNLGADAVPMAGNLDAREIRRICSDHGISRQAGSGDDLRVVKIQRNALAHGDKSFGECGREYSVSDLERIKDEAVAFVRKILANMNEYMTQKGYEKKIR